MQFEEKKSTRKCNVGVQDRAQGAIKLQEDPDAKWNKGRSDVRVRPHPIMLPTCEKKLKKSLIREEKHQQQKASANSVSIY